MPEKPIIALLFEKTPRFFSGARSLFVTDAPVLLKKQKKARKKTPKTRAFAFPFVAAYQIFMKKMAFFMKTGPNEPK